MVMRKKEGSMLKVCKHGTHFYMRSKAARLTSASIIQNKKPFYQATEKACCAKRLNKINSNKSRSSSTQKS